MKKLDEVIDALGRCWSDHCFDCPYHEKTYEESCIRKRDTDTLHYLRTYRENQHAYEENSRKAEEARERYEEAVKNCELAENKYRKMEDELNDIRREHIKKMSNDPLSWDELKIMKGKPVWVEYNFRISNKEFRDNSKRWCIIREFKPWNDTEIIITENGFVLSKREQVTDWQAYRKERE